MASPAEKANPAENLELNQSLPYLNELKDEGYNPVAVLRNSDRFVAYKVHGHGSDYFFKGLRKASGTSLENEVWFSGQLSASQTPDTVARAPKIVRKANKWYISEFYEGQELCLEANCFNSNLAPSVGTITQILLELDSLAVQDSLEATEPEVVEGKTVELSAKAVAADIINEDLRGQALGIVGNHLISGPLRIQHGDFTPWHIFRLDDGKYGLVDSEHAGSLPRFTDLATIYERLYNRCNAPGVAAKLLATFIEHRTEGRDSFFEEFLPALTNKASIGAFYSTIDWVKHDYKSSSKDLVVNCVTKDIDALIAP